ncbi:hypothetical protein ABIA33_007388, partial [Streptacidiphilus sp. MAP12-16]
GGWLPGGWSTPGTPTRDVVAWVEGNLRSAAAL